MKKTLFSIILVAISLISFAGSKETAKSISPKSNCNHTAGAWGGGTQMNLTPATTGSRNDAWFKFTASNFAYEISYSYAVSYTVESDDPEASVTYNGDSFTVNKLDAVYYLRIYTWSSSSSTLNQYFCFYNVASNGEKDNAIELTAETPCFSNSNAFYNAGSSGVATSCQSGDYSDIWYKFVAQSNTYNFTANTGTSLAFQIEVIDNDNVIKCASGIITNGNSIATAAFTLSNLTVGKTYHIRAFKDWSNGDLSFNACATPDGLVGTIDLEPSKERAVSKAFNIHGQEIPVNTRGQVIILLYSDGSRETIFRTK